MKSATHILTNDKKLSCNQGELVPIGIVEALPGDKIDHETAALIRVQPLLAPVMHEVDVDIYHFFVPFRIIWNDWENFITGGPDGLNASVPPYITTPASTGFAIGSLADYLTVPPGVPDRQVSALPFRAYALIWNTFFRDQDLETELTIDLTDGADTTTNTALQNACWQKDRYTSARPTPQKGPDVSLPLGGDAPITGIGINTSGFFGVSNQNNVRETESGSSVTYPYAYETNADSMLVEVDSNGSSPRPQIFADLSGVTAATIEDLRVASAFQRFMENTSMFGSRYWERLQAAFGVRTRDSRFQIPEYLGGGRQKIQFSEVLQTAEGTDPVGQMAGHGIALAKSNRYKFYAPEYGYIISLMTVRPKTQYVDGLPLLWSRQTKEEFFQPELQHLGQQPIRNKEVYFAHSNPDGVFGYQDCYDEYRYIPSTIAGEFRDTLNYWHMAREFTADPALNATFVKANPTTRIYAAPGSDQLYVAAKHRLRMRRRLIKHAKPMLF